MEIVLRQGVGTRKGASSGGVEHRTGSFGEISPNPWPAERLLLTPGFVCMSMSPSANLEMVPEQGALPTKQYVAMLSPA